MTKSELMLRQVEQWQVRIDYTKYDNLIALLFINYQLMVASENLLRVAVSRSDGQLREYFKNHLSEEAGHAEWLDRDLTSVGYDVTKFKIQNELAELAGSQYYHLYHGKPATILGYLLVLEAFPMSLDMVETLEYLHGVDVMRTMRYHAEHDINHRQDLFDIINELDDTSMIDNAIRVAEVLNNTIRKLFGIVDEQDLVKQWVSHKTDCEISNKSVAIGKIIDGQVVAGVMYDHYTGESISSTFAVDDKTKVTKDFIKEMFAYPFDQLHVNKIINYVSKDNEQSRNITEKFGFVHETTITGVFPEGDMDVYVMEKANCKWLGAQHG